MLDSLKCKDHGKVRYTLLKSCRNVAQLMNLLRESRENKSEPLISTRLSKSVIEVTEPREPLRKDANRPNEKRVHNK